MKKLILTVLTLCFVLLTAMTALADQKKITRADIAKILNRPDIMGAEDVVTYGNKIVVIYWGVDQNNNRHIEAISLPADKVRAIGNSTREHVAEDSGQYADNNKYGPEEGESYGYVERNQSDSEKNDPYLEKIKKAVEKVWDSQSMDGIIVAKNMLMSVEWDISGYYGRSLCEFKAGHLLIAIRDVPNVYSVYTDLIYYAIQQSATESQYTEVAYFTEYVKNHAKEKTNEAIDFLNSLLDADWKNSEAKKYSEKQIKEGIKELEELQEN